MIRTLRVRGRYDGFEGVVSYLTEVLPNETDKKAAERATKNYFMKRNGILVSFEEVDEVMVRSSSLPMIEGLESLGYHEISDEELNNEDALE